MMLQKFQTNNSEELKMIIGEMLTYLETVQRQFDTESTKLNMPQLAGLFNARFQANLIRFQSVYEWVEELARKKINLNSSHIMAIADRLTTAYSYWSGVVVEPLMEFYSEDFIEMSLKGSMSELLDDIRVSMNQAVDFITSLLDTHNCQAEICALVSVSAVSTCSIDTVPLNTSQQVEKACDSEIRLDGRPEISKIRWDSIDKSYSIHVRGQRPAIRERVEASHIRGLGENENTMKVTAQKFKDQWIHNLGASVKKSNHDLLDQDEIITREDTIWGRPYYQANGKSCALTMLMSMLPAFAQRDGISKLPLPRTEVETYLLSGIGPSFSSFLNEIGRKTYLQYRLGVVGWTKHLSPTDVLRKLVNDHSVARGDYLVICGGHCILVNTQLMLFVDSDSNSPDPFQLSLDKLKGECIDRCNELYELRAVNMKDSTREKYRIAFDLLC